MRKSEHNAINHLIAHGAWYGDTVRGRAKCALALREARRDGREHARWLRSHLYFISGSLPRKLSDPLHPSRTKPNAENA